MRHGENPSSVVLEVPGPHGGHGMDGEALDALIERRRHEPPVMTDDEWQEFAEAIDAARRPYRTIFS